MTDKLTISAEQADRLFWLGRYVERVYLTLKLFNNTLDAMIDEDAQSRIEDFCERLSIPSYIYAGADDFETRYLFDEANPDSLYSNLSRAYDNAIILRNFITSESLSFVQMALDRLHEGKVSQSAFLETQQVADWLLAFWGSIEETVLNPERRDLLKVGKYVEHIDLVIRLEQPYEILTRMLPRLESRVSHVSALLQTDKLQALHEIASDETVYEANRKKALALINSLHC